MVELELLKEEQKSYIHEFICVSRINLTVEQHSLAKPYNHNLQTDEDRVGYASIPLQLWIKRSLRKHHQVV